MASRTSNPAQFTSTGTTENNSRGGLFVQSNLANNVSGFVVPTVTVNDATIRIVQGTTELGAFTLNQSNNDTIMIPESTGTGSGPATIPDGTVIGAAYAAGTPTSTLTLTIQGLVDPLVIPIPAGLDAAAVQVLIDASIAAIDVGVRTVNGMAPDAAGNVDITVGADINVGNGDMAADANMMLSGLVIDPDTNFRIRELADGTFIFEGIPTTPPGPNPVPATTRTTLVPPPMDIFEATPDAVPTTTITEGTVTPNTTPTTTVTIDGTPVTTTPTTEVNPDRTTVTTTIPGTDIDSPGDYEITTTIRVTPDDPTSPPTTVTETETFTRFVPYYVVRGVEPTTPDAVRALTAEATEFNTASFVTPAGDTGSVFLIIDSATLPNTNDRAFGDVRGFPVTWERRTRTGGPIGNHITLTDANGTNYEYDVYRANIVGSQTISNFRLEAR